MGLCYTVSMAINPSLGACMVSVFSFNARVRGQDCEGEEGERETERDASARVRESVV